MPASIAMFNSIYKTMKKITKWRAVACRKNVKKGLLTMKLIAFLVVVLNLNLSANVWAQRIEKLNFKETPLREVFKELNKQTGVFFMYNESKLDNNIVVSKTIEDMELLKALDLILKDIPYKYKKYENYVLITPKIVKDNKKEKKNEIKGIVKDKKGNPLVGVSVYIKGTTSGVSTNTQGRFTIAYNKKEKITLVFSFIGMKEKKVLVKDQKELNVVLEEDVSELNEVVVTGYQTIERRKLASSVISVSADDIKESGAISVDKMLQGKLAGVAVIGQTSTPGAAPKIRIRGASSISGNREPVWVLDGVILDDPVQISTEELNSLDKVNLIGNAISSINPEDIDRIDILKDASATAIYGVKAANGVIVVTTKKGKYGPARVKYSGGLSITAHPEYKDMFRMNSEERIEMSEEMHLRGFAFETDQPTNVAYEGALMDYWDKKIDYNEFLAEVDRVKGLNTNWYNLLFRTAVTNHHSISVSGATDKVNYYFSGGFADNQGATMNVSEKRYNAMMNISAEIASNLRVGFKMNGALRKTQRPHGSLDLYSYAYNTSRAIPAYDNEGNNFFYAQELGYKNSLMFNVFDELDNTDSSQEVQSLSMNFTVDWKIASWLKYNAMFSMSRNTTSQISWANEKSFYVAKERKMNYGEILPDNDSRFVNKECKLPLGGEYKNTNTTNSSYTVRNNIALFKSFGNHDFSANIGTELRSSSYDGLKSVQRGYLRDRGEKFAQIDLTKWKLYADWIKKNPNVITNNVSNYLSYYGTFTYCFGDKYTANFNIRGDGSNKFGQDKSVRFLPVWSVAGRWNIMNEGWFKNLMWLNNFAVRASYGVQGNVHPDQTPNLIARIGDYDDISQEYASLLYKLPNNSLKWEKTESMNLGLDFSLFNNLIFGTVETYRKYGKDQVIQKTVSPTTGGDYVAINYGNVENKGWELFLTTTPINTKDITWSISFNTAKNYNKVTTGGDNKLADVPEEGDDTDTQATKSITYLDYLNGSAIIDGMPIGGFYSYKFNGLDKNGYPTFIGEVEKDADGNMLVNSLQEAFDRAFIYSGKRMPDLTGGFSTYFKYKQFSINGMFSFNLGNKLRLNDLYASEGQKLPFPQQNMSSDFVNRWRKPGDEAHTNIPTISDHSLALHTLEYKYRIGNNKWDMYNKSDIRVVSGDFLRLRNISLRYDLTSDVCKRFNVKGMQFSFDMSNVFCWKSSDLKGRDPEQITMGSRTIPPQKTYTFSMNVTF
jgi:TonB-linked SusC/RagA family outer membrane protein